MNKKNKRSSTKTDVKLSIQKTKQQRISILQESDAKYRGFIENLPVMFYAAEPCAPYSPIYVSPAFEMFGYPIEAWRESLDMWVRALHEDDRERVLRATEAAMKAGKETDFEYRIVARDGSVSWVRDRGCFVRDEQGNPICWQGIIIDVTERKQAKQELEMREKLYRTLARNIPHTAVLLFDQDFRYTLAEGLQLNRHGFSREMFEGKTLGEVFPPDIYEEWSEYYRRALGGELVSLEQTSDEGSFQIWVVPVKNETDEVFAGMVVWQDITIRKQAEEALTESEIRYRALFENANDLIYIHDLDGNYLAINEAAERVIGYTREEALRMNIKDIIAPEYLKIAKRMLAKKLNGAEQTSYELDCITKDGKRLTLEVNSSTICKDGVPVAVQGIARDVTERKQAEEALKQSEEQYRDLFENANDLIYTHDLLGNFTSINRAGEVITGFSREEALKMNISKVVAPDFLEAAREMTARKVEGEAPTAYELEIIAKDGHRVSLELSTRLIYHNERPVGVQGIGRDITARKRAEEKLKHYAMHDTLTGLPNRAQFMNHLEMAIERGVGNSFARFAVLFLDLDRFKVINDSLGHIIGDKLLVAIAERLKSCVRPGDVVARLGGDEFTILLNRTGGIEDVSRVAERLQKKLSVPFKLDNYEVFTSASIGIIVSDEMKRTSDDFLRDADAAMYRAKESGKARYEIFDSAMHVRNMNLLKVETDLRHAVERGEFEVYYQPIVTLESGEIREFEALIRWQHPQHGMIAPDEFISVAEETGLIIPIGKWILEEACRQISEWQKRFPLLESVSVNLSAKQLMHPSLTAQVSEVLEQTGLNPRSLKLEVTESTVMENSEIALGVLSELHKLGISLSTDDFGTGYSSLSYLHRFPFERLKIDRSFINKMDLDDKCEAIVRTILMLGQNLNIETVAEGIETEKQLERLRLLGCPLGQGYLFSKPLTAESAGRLLEEGLPFALDSMFGFDTQQNQILEVSEIH